MMGVTSGDAHVRILWLSRYGFIMSTATPQITSDRWHLYCVDAQLLIISDSESATSAWPLATTYSNFLVSSS